MQVDTESVARKRGRFLLQRATQGMQESEGWAALLQLLDLLEDFAQHLIKASASLSKHVVTGVAAVRGS